MTSTLMAVVAIFLRANIVHTTVTTTLDKRPNFVIFFAGEFCLLSATR